MLCLWQHALMDVTGSLAVKDNVSVVLHSPKSGTNIITCTAQRWIIGKHLAARLKIIDITDGLVLPQVRRVKAAILSKSASARREKRNEVTASVVGEA